VIRKGKHYQWTFGQYLSDVVAFAKSLHAIGVDSFKAVNIMGFNSPEWAISFIGSIFHNNIASGVYTTNGPEACLYQASHSEAQVVVVDNVQQL
jgi:long-chain-fatty-acid--CoA ligase ACSBG